jgi:phosphoglycerate dehydrogenase-like enzyme
VRIAVLDDFHHAWEPTTGLRRLRERADVTVFTTPFGNPAALHGFDALIANRERTRFDRSLLSQLSGVKIIAQTGNHAYHIDFAAARDCGIVIAKASGGFCTGAAELVFGLAIALMRQIPSVDAAVKAGHWSTPLGRELHGKTIGIVGLGRIGSHVARIAGAFGMRVLSWSRHGDAARAAAVGATHVELDDLLRQSDIVTVHATLSAESRGLLDRRRLGLMKPISILINTSRGPVVDEAALIEVLEQRAIAGAGLDVFDTEPLPAGHPLAALPNVILTPHIGWPTDKMYEQFAGAAADALLAFMDGHEPPRFTEVH